MPGTLKKGAIQFGLVYIPVSLYTTVTEGRTSFNQLYKGTNVRIRYKKVREDTGMEVSSADIVKGYQYESGKYVVIEDDELERMKSPKDKAISIIQFVPRDSINPVFYDKAYYLTPDGSDKAYALLHAAMMKENVMAVARTVIGTNETMLTISPMGNGSLLMETLFFIDEVKPVPQSVGQMPVNDAEVQMAGMMIKAMKGTYQPEAHHDTYAQRLHEAILKKIQGQQVVQPQEDALSAIDLMEALTRSLQMVPGLTLPQTEETIKPQHIRPEPLQQQENHPHRPYERTMPNFGFQKPTQEVPPPAQIPPMGQQPWSK